jgi:hypothetical protein
MILCGIWEAVGTHLSLIWGQFGQTFKLVLVKLWANLV